MLNESELRAEQLSDLVVVVATHGETTAAVGSPGRKGRDDDMPGGLQDRPQRTDVGRPVVSVGQKVQDGPVMPEVDRIDAPEDLRIGEITLHPFDTSGLLRRREGGRSW